MSELYSSSLIKRKRRTKDEMCNLFNEVADIINGYKERITIRHLFYRMVGQKALEKDENNYAILCSHLSKWRKEGILPYSCFVDSTRWYHGGVTFDDAAEALDDAIKSYRKNLWKTQKYYVEVWAEKDAILSLIMPVVSQWHLQAFPCRGFTSLSSTFSAAETFKEAIEYGRRPVILYVGDHDPSGVAMDVSIEKHLGYHGLHGMVTIKRVAILPCQIAEFDLPTRPVKRTDPRAKRWDGSGCVEIDTLSSQQIRDLLNQEIEALVDGPEWRRLKLVEEAERETLSRIADAFRTQMEDEE
jgi:hypothetical protein